MTVYHFNTVLTEGRYNGKTIQEVFDNHPDFIMKTLKKWAINKVMDKEFDDEILEAAHITKHVRGKQTFQEEFMVVRDKDAIKPMKKLKKDTKSLDEIFDEMENERYNIKEDLDDNKEYNEQEP